MKRSQSFIEHQNKIIAKAEEKQKELAKKAEKDMNSLKRESREKVRAVEDKVDELKKSKYEKEEKIGSLQKEISGIKQAWGVSNKTKDLELAALKKADASKLTQAVEKATKASFAEGEESGQKKYEKAAQLSMAKQQQQFAQQ